MRREFRVRRNYKNNNMWDCVIITELLNGSVVEFVYATRDSKDKAFELMLKLAKGCLNG